MQHPIGAGTPEPNPDDVAVLAEMERHLAELAPVSPAALVVSGETKRVAQLRAEVAEADLLIELQEREAPLLLDTERVRRRRKKAAEAARLHQLAQDPTMRAWQASRMRRLLVAGAMVSLALALAWSTAGVQHFAADGAAAWTPGWLFAWFVEPFMSVALLVFVGARAYLGTLGQPVKSRTLVGVELLFLGLTFGMNAFPYLPGVTETFSIPRLVLHILGPIVAVAVVLGLPVILAAFSDLDHGPTSRGLLADRTGKTSARSGVALGLLTAHARRLIEDGALPAEPSATAIRKALGGSTDTARAVRDELGKGGAA